MLKHFLPLATLIAGRSTGFRHVLSGQSTSISSHSVVCIFDLLSVTRKRQRMPQPLTPQLLSSSSSTSSSHCTLYSTVHHLVSAGPRSSSAAVVRCQRAAVLFSLALVTRLPHVTQRVNANKARECQLAIAWSLLRLRVYGNGGPWLITSLFIVGGRMPYLVRLTEDSVLEINRLWFQSGPVIECAETMAVRLGETFVPTVAGIRREFFC